MDVSKLHTDFSTPKKEPQKEKEPSDKTEELKIDLANTSISEEGKKSEKSPKRQASAIKRKPSGKWDITCNLLDEASEEKNEPLSKRRKVWKMLENSHW